MRILTPLLGDDRDADTLAAARALAEPVGGRVIGAFIAAASTNALAWSSETALSVLEMNVGFFHAEPSDAEIVARERLAALDYPKTSFVVAADRGCAGLRQEARLVDVIVFERDALRGHGFFAGAFQQMLMDERRPIFSVARARDITAPIAVAWDGSREASRATRRAIPWLRKARDVAVLIAPAATSREFEPLRLIDYLAEQRVSARLVPLAGDNEAGPLLLDAAEAMGASMLVAGAFGHSRFQRFIFGGTTRTLLDNARDMALFISH